MSESCHAWLDAHTVSGGRRDRTIMIDLSGPMRDLMTVEGAEAAERVQAWRRVLMGVWHAGFGDGYAANESDASVRAALSFTRGIQYMPAPVVPGAQAHQEVCTPETPCPEYPECSSGGERSAAGAGSNGCGGPLDSSTL